MRGQTITKCSAGGGPITRNDFMICQKWACGVCGGGGGVSRLVMGGIGDVGLWEGGVEASKGFETREKRALGWGHQLGPTACGQTQTGMGQMRGVLVRSAACSGSCR